MADWAGCWQCRGERGEADLEIYLDEITDHTCCWIDVGGKE